MDLLNFENLRLPVLFLSMLASSAGAAITGVNGGTAAPGSTLGGYSMIQFGTDSQASDVDVTSVATPVGGSVGFSPTVEHTTIGDDWDTWSNGYTGDVYALYVDQSDVITSNVMISKAATVTPDAVAETLSLTLTLPAGTKAFYLYAEPDDTSASYAMSAVANGANTVNETVAGEGGAGYFGFYATGINTLSTIVVSTVINEENDGMAVGEFGINSSAVPEPSSLLLLCVGGLSLLGRRRGGRN